MSTYFFVTISILFLRPFPVFIVSCYRTFTEALFTQANCCVQVLFGITITIVGAIGGMYGIIVDSKSKLLCIDHKCFSCQIKVLGSADLFLLSQITLSTSKCAFMSHTVSTVPIIAAGLGHMSDTGHLRNPLQECLP